MGKKESIERWVDSSGLPRQNGTGKRIDWGHSVGCSLPFKYGKISGKIDIVEVPDCINGERSVMVTIDKYVTIPTRIRTSCLCAGNIGHFVHNKIIDIRPDLMQYLDNQDDAYKYSYCSAKSINMHCPVCGYKKQYDAAHLSTQGFGCPICGDGVKYPNKFISALLNQLHIDYVREANKSHQDLFWAQDFRYDFYIKLNSKKILIEADGGFHRYEDQKNRDAQKDILAMQHGFQLIRIDCDYRDEDRFTYIKEHIIQSELNHIINLSHINWEQCNKQALSSIIYEACLLWNAGKSTREISDLIGVCIQTVAKYLRKGAEVSLCTSYSVGESMRRANYKPILCWSEQHSPCVFKNVDELVELSVVYFGKRFNKGRVRNTCQNKQSAYYGLFMKYITKEEYEQYKMINNNEVVLKEAI